jgi:S1-C subfamily serine protease
MKEILKITFFSILGGTLSLIGYTTLVKKEANKDFKYNSDLAHVAIPVKNYSNENSEAVAVNIDFTTAAEKTIHAVVHVTNTTSYRQPRSIFEYYNNQGEQIQKGSTGSGVVISEDGYIVTNNHVIEDAEELTVTLNNQKSYTAKVIGSDKKK